MEFHTGNSYLNARLVDKNNEEAGDPLSYEKVSATAAYLLERTEYRPTVSIICGSGLAHLAELLERPDIFDYSNIPNFPVSTVPGHKSRLLFGLLNGVSVMVMQGRFHIYEGYSISRVAMPVRVMKLCGIETMIVTNAAGGLGSGFEAGDIMIIKDHINIPGFTGLHPLRGPNDKRFGGRFFALNNSYDKQYRQAAKKICKEMGLEKKIHEGVYTMLTGPNFETVSELKMMKVCGVDAVGMSTIPEVLVARHCDIRVFAFSLITNKCITEEDSELFANHEEVIDIAEKSKDRCMKLVSRMVSYIGSQKTTNGQRQK